MHKNFSHRKEALVNDQQKRRQGKTNNISGAKSKTKCNSQLLESNWTVVQIRRVTKTQRLLPVVALLYLNLSKWYASPSLNSYKIMTSTVYVLPQNSENC